MRLKQSASAHLKRRLTSPSCRFSCPAKRLLTCSGSGWLPTLRLSCRRGHALLITTRSPHRMNNLRPPQRTSMATPCRKPAASHSGAARSSASRIKNNRRPRNWVKNSTQTQARRQLPKRKSTPSFSDQPHARSSSFRAKQAQTV